jgi:hypothetical protein
VLLRVPRAQPLPLSSRVALALYTPLSLGFFTQAARSHNDVVWKKTRFFRALQTP